MNDRPELHFPFPDSLDFDADGCPSSARLEQIQRADDIRNAGRWLTEELPILLQEQPCLVEVSDSLNAYGQNIRVVVLIASVTWRWHGPLVRALRRGILGRFYLWSWHRGERYEFHVPLMDIEH